MRAGLPANEKDFKKREVEGIPLYIHNSLADKSLEIQWFGFWVFGQLVVGEF